MPGCSPPCVEEAYGAGIDESQITLQTFSVDYYDETDEHDDRGMPCSLSHVVPFSYDNVWMIPTNQVTLYRRKWNYVKNLYQPAYFIDINGDWNDSRPSSFEGGVCSPEDTHTPNMSKRLDDNKYERTFYDDLLSWCTYMKGRPAGTIFEKFLQWQYEIGTVMYGNLPQYNKNNHTGHCWMPCPYSTDSTDERTEAMLGFNVAKVDHGNYYMITQSKGNVWGYECTSNSCPYYVGTGNTKRYFYV